MPEWAPPSGHGGCRREGAGMRPVPRAPDEGIRHLRGGPLCSLHPVHARRGRYQLEMENGRMIIHHFRDGRIVAMLRVRRDPITCGFIAESGCHFTTSFRQPLKGENLALEEASEYYMGHSIIHSIRGCEW